MFDGLNWFRKKNPTKASQKEATMLLELIPVIEIGYHNQDVAAPTPNQYPYWEHFERWDQFRQECHLKAGFKDRLIPYLAGSAFFKLSELTLENLKKLVIDHTHDLRTGKYDRASACPFFGGYVLKRDGSPQYYPQCCGDLSDIHYWEALSNGQYHAYEGHPAPNVTIETETIVLDFSIGEFDEPFQPTPVEQRLKLDRLALKQAVQNVKQELDSFAERIHQINEDENLKIEKIADLLIGHRSIDF